MFDKYLTELNRLYRSGNATEHSYRPALQDCLTHLLKNVQVTNEPKRQKCGAPDYILTRRKIDIGYIEAKNIGVDLNHVERGGKDDDQWQRYTESLDNIILTDYLEFRFFLNGQRVEQIRIADATSTGIIPKPENFTRLQNLLMDFAAFQGQTIKSAKKLAEMMARKSALMRDVFFKAVTDESAGESSLKDQLKAFQTVLMHDMDAAQFADVYAQTIAYGLFTARLHDKTVKDFSRAEALTLIPKSNPFLRQLFQYVAGPDLDDRVVWIVDALCEVYRAADLHAILKDFGVTTGQNDPILHFYETFLAEYDPKLRKSRGVWYTPEPVVRFIVRAIDDVLKTHFGLKEGLGDTSKITIKVDGHAGGKPIKVNETVHKVQLLDVATGTGTFLAEVVKQIYARFKGQEGMWSGYVEEHLLPRMHGFELLMASYAMCHMKLDLLLTETGYRPSKTGNPPRLSVYLTNSLEEHHKDSHLPFANWLSQEANAASRIKREMPIMVVLGNPPYNSSSTNKGEWISNLLRDYKTGLSEKKSNIEDDYIKFIRLSEFYINKNKSGIVALITNNSFIDGVTQRVMRYHLLQTFDELYIFDLGGDVKKAEALGSDGADQNVFDIQQGVSISVFIKNSGNKKSLGKVYYRSLRGKRQDKYDILSAGRLIKSDFCEVAIQEPNYFFYPRDYGLAASYESFIAINELFSEYSSGIQTKKDDVAIQFLEADIDNVVGDFRNLDVESLKKKYHVDDDGVWKASLAKNDILSGDFNILPIQYRVFDFRYTALTKKSGGFLGRPRYDIMQHMVSGRNIGLIVNRQHVGEGFSFVFITKFICNHGTFYLGNRGQDYLLPLYLSVNDLASGGRPSTNLNPKIYKAIQKIIPDVQPQSLFDYIYAVLHSCAYRQRYAEFLKSDFPRIPYPKDKKTFHALAARGAELRELHLMESPALDTLITTYPTGGDHEVVALRWEDTKGKPGLGRVWINPTQYFDNVPLTAWNFYIGGYQPAQKWLKDRKGRKLTSDDLLHWQRIIVALTETDKVMTEIDRIEFLPE
jgi:predicted helicase